jgi:hypothetical protein
VELQIIETQLSDSDVSTGNRSDNSPSHEQRSTEKKYSEVAIEKYYKGQNLLLFSLSLHTRKSTDM